jgi:hypothetical protein
MRIVRGVSFVVGWTLFGVAGAQQQLPLATVHLIGTQHAPGQLLQAAMSPAHVRAALAAIAPDVVCVESAPEWFAAGHFYRETYEANGIALPWARERGLPVYGIDWVGNENAGHWHERERRARVEQERDDLGAAAVDVRRFAYGAVAASQLREARPDPWCDFARLNGADFAARTVADLDARRDEPGSAQHYVARRNVHIADHVAAAAKAHPGKRLAVVIGAAHVGDLQRLLPARGLAVATVPDVARLAVDDDGLAIADVVAMLTHATDSGRGERPAAARCERLLARLGREAASLRGDLAVLAAYVDARQQQLAGEPDAAARGFAQLIESGAAVRFPYRGHDWRLHLTVAQAARLELGRMADLAGNRARAVGHYEALLATLPEPPFDGSEHSDFEFAARARNAVRGLLQTPFTADMAFARVAPRSPAPTPALDAAARGARTAKLQAAWQLHRDKQWQRLREAAAGIERDGLYATELLELDYHLAVASVELGERVDAATRVAALEARAAELGADHWLSRSLPQLRRRVQ